MFNWRRYLGGSFGPVTFRPEDSDGAPHHRTEGFNHVLGLDHVTNSCGEPIIVIVIHGVLAIRGVKCLQLAQRLVIAETLNITKASPEAGSRKNDLQQARCGNRQITLCLYRQ
jgi:hypothetical protein